MTDEPTDAAKQRHTGDQLNILGAVHRVIDHDVPGYILVVEGTQVTTYGRVMPIQQLVGELEIQKIAMVRTGLAQREREQ